MGRRILLRTLCAIIVCVVLWLAPRSLMAGIEGHNWYPIGPAPGNFGAFPGGIAGRATSIDINPQNFQDIWVGTAQGGVWHSTNGGLTWVPTTDTQMSHAIGSIKVRDCTINGCQRIYAGTGENAIRRDTYYGRGLLVGTAGAGGTVSWSLKTGYPYGFYQGSIVDIALDPTTSGASQRIFVALSSGVTASATESTVTAPEPKSGYSIYRSDDNGNTWVRIDVHRAVVGDRPTDLEMDPSDSQIMYAGFYGRGIFKTTNGGSSWCPMNKGIPKPTGCPNYQGLPNLNNTSFDHVEIAISPSDPDTLYATFGNCPDPLIASCAPSLYKSTDQGMHWSQMYAGSTTPVSDCPDGYSRYTHALTVHPTVPSTLFLGGIQLCKSVDGGATWSYTDTNTLGGVAIHFDHHEVIFRPGDPTKVYDLNDGGVAFSKDGGDTWTPANGNMQTLGFQSIAASPLTARIIGGAQDNAGQMWTGLDSWKFLPCCGDGGFSIMDLDDPMKMYVTTNWGSTVIPKRSSDGGASFNDPINSNLGQSEPRSFYPPFIQDTSPPHPLYFGTNRLYKSTDDAASWTIVSPTLSTLTEPEIVGGKDAITAIAVAPSDPSRIYIGYYSGKVFATQAACALPCPGIGCCWQEKHLGLPAAPITSLAVDPVNPDRVYATLSGFFPGFHVFRSTNGGSSWSTLGLGSPYGVPANTILVEPSDPMRLWLGTDIGVYKSTLGGASWLPHQSGMPTVPVYQFAIDEKRGRLFAGTHGRGAYILTRASLAGNPSWVKNKLNDLYIVGYGFKPNQTCTLSLLRKDSTQCGSDTTDYYYGSITTDSVGRLVSSTGTTYANHQVVWVCRSGLCLKNVEPGPNCSWAGQPGPAAVVANCTQESAFALVNGPTTIISPPSSWVSLTGQQGFSLTDGKQDPVESLVGGSFQVLPTLQVGDGSTRTLCSVDVPFTSTQTQKEILETARDLINADTACSGSGVSAEVQEGRPGFEAEDLFPEKDFLSLNASGLDGSQLIASVHTASGQSTGLCFQMEHLGVPVHDQLGAMKVRFETASPGGASGGEIVLRENTGLGVCSIRIPTTAGQTAAEIAQLVEEQFQAPGIPGPNPDCPSEVNARDVLRRGDSLMMAAPHGLEVCIDDAGVGFALAPGETCFSDADCDDGNPCSRDTCNLATHECSNAPEPDGLPCDDGNACTVGGTCVSGTCGVPLSCDDTNPCTEDVCDPTTGRCQNPPVVCDDGNICTSDVCSIPDGGACQFLPMTGQDCDDGDLCTTGETCQADLTGLVTCQGPPTCDDGDGCTVDVCDQTSGACTYPQMDCNDGDPCTLDTCSAGACRLDPVAGMTCDDGSACTTDDLCVDDGAGSLRCTGVSISCDDTDMCTLDTCDEATGVCGHVAAAVSPTMDLAFSSDTMMSWVPPGASGYSNTYKGSIGASLMAGRMAPYDHVCYENGDEGGDGPDISTDITNPSVGEGFYYAITYVEACGESPPCLDDDGTPCPLPSPCPTIP